MSDHSVACHGFCSLDFRSCAVFLGILISVAGTSLLVSHLTCWSFLVLGTLSTSGWLKPKVSSSSFVTFFVVSVLGGLLFLISNRLSICSGLVLQLALMLKLGFAPFQFWIYNLIRPLDLPSACFFLGPLKFGLLWLLVSSFSCSYILLWFPLLLGLFLLWVSPSCSVLLYASGSSQVLILFILGSSLFPLYYLIYMLALTGIALVHYSLLGPVFAFLCLGGLPPLTIFVAKALAISNLSFFHSLLVLLISIISLYPYFFCSLNFSVRVSRSPTVSSFLILSSWFIGLLFY